MSETQRDEYSNRSRPRLLETLRAEMGSAEESQLDSELQDASSQPLTQTEIDDAIDTIIGSAEVLPTVEFQRRVTRAVDDLLSRRRRSLPALLEETRLEADISATQLAKELGLSTETLESLETGKQKLWHVKDLDPIDLVIAWIERLGIKSSVARLAAARTIPKGSAPAYGERNRDDRKMAEHFVVRLRQALDARDD